MVESRQSPPGAPGSAAGQDALLAALDRSLAMLTLGPDGRIADVNDNLLAAVGYARSDLIGQPHSILSDPSQPTDTDELWRQLRAGKPVTALVRRRARDGTPVWFEATYNPVLDDQGHLVEVIKLGADVTARVTRELADDERLHLLSLGVDATDNAVLISDKIGRARYVNAGFTRMFGYTADDIVGRLASEPFGEQPALRQAFRESLMAVREGQGCHTEVLVLDKLRQPLWVSLVSNPIFDEAGELIHIVSLFTDITQSKIQEVLQHKALAAMVRDAPLVEVMTLICRELETIAPEVLASILRVDETGHLHTLAGPSLPPEYHEAVDGLAIGPYAGTCGTAAYFARPVIVTDMETDPLWANFRFVVKQFGLAASWSMPIVANDGRVCGTLAFYYRTKRGPDALHEQLLDVCVHLCKLAFERDESRARIRQLAFSDSLTGLPNRSMLHARAVQAVASAQGLEASLAVLFIDLDRFKQVNDSLGHQAGDTLLRTVGERLRRELRGADIVARLSGDEFVVVLTECNRESVNVAINRLQTALSAPCKIGRVTLIPSGSIGVSLYPADGRDFDTLLQRADMAMYQAKLTNRGNVCFFSDDLDARAQERLELETAMRDALRQGTLRLHYQPQVNLLDEHVCGVEALTRWMHPELGEIAPSRFIALAEECGLIGELGTWTLRESCRQLADWRDRGIGISTVAVNLSPTNFHDHELPHKIAETLLEFGLSPSNLSIEITESVLMDNNPNTLRIIDRVHALGVRLSMDDFGTGYSSLGYLRRLPVSELKLDRSFVHDVARDETVRALTSAIISIGHSLHLTVVAEGVENEDQRAVLVSQGYRVAQGYLFSPALAPHDLEPWLAQWNASRHGATDNGGGELSRQPPVVPTPAAG
ncbi:diguanylate cyclase [Pandoraea terrae]|uniref:Diguanylate cyclase n=1 Tax=Pandoraea terrae TaxID=1537710 RepID=A0A5E4YLV5_9BURK|nr:EAL domain-containing protein [Pandoraea terrae]VVE49749.1 diguanylate cyclase [Pandoraea terrae]